MWFNTPMCWILKSPLHSLLSGSMMIINYTGRKSGTLFSVPVNYVAVGDTYWVVSFRQRTWWRNLRGGASVHLWLKGQDRAAHGQVLEDGTPLYDALTLYLKQVPQAAKAFHVQVDAAGNVNPSEVAQAAQKLVMIRFQLT